MRTAPLLLVLLVAPGCVLAIKGSSAPVAFTSEPSGATVALDHEQRPTRRGKPEVSSCVTPCELRVRRSEVPTGYNATLAGHEPFNGEMVQAEDWNAALLLPSIFDGLLIIPGLIDISERVGWDPPKSVHLVLPPVGAGAPRAVVAR